MNDYTSGGANDPSIDMLIRQLQNQGLSNEQIERVLSEPQASQPSTKTKANANNLQSNLGALAFLANGNPLVAAAIAKSGSNTPLSQNDGVFIRQAEPDAIGAYETSDQKLQDVYNSTPAGQRGMNAGRQGQPDYYGGLLDMNIPPVGMSNPNYRVTSEGSNMSVNDNGDIVRW